MAVLPRNSRQQRERGYMLLILMFFVMLLTFSMMAILPRVAQQAKRDREEEMMHRGTEYARAVKKFYKKFNRYPNRLEDLENTNQFRFIRKRYKDPFSKDGNWRLLHITDVQQGVSNPNFGMSQAGNFNPAQGNPQAAGGLAAGVQGTANAQGFSLGTPDATQGDNPNQGPSGGAQSPFGGGGQSPFSSGNSSSPLNNPVQQGGGVTSGSNPSLGGQLGQTYGAGGIVGVESMSKAKSIREFNKKSNYNKWMFIYDPTQDRGNLLKGPYNPQAFMGGGVSGANPTGAGAQPGTNGSVFGPNAGQQQPQNAPAPSMPPDANAPPQ